MKNMANKIINVLIVDDEQIVREGLRYIIDWNTLGFCICGEAANGEDALEMIRQYRPGLVLLDIRMSGMLGTELMEKARSEGFSGAFIILSGYSDFKYAQTALQFGASYYLTKPIDEDELESILAKIKTKNPQITRFKGLGEMNASQLRETTMDPNTRRLVQLDLDDAQFTASLLDKLLAKKRSADRKHWLEQKGNLADLVV